MTTGVILRSFNLSFMRIGDESSKISKLKGLKLEVNSLSHIARDLVMGRIWKW